MRNTIHQIANAFAIVFASAYIFCLSACTKDTGLTIKSNKNEAGATQTNAASVFTSSDKFQVSILTFVPCANNGNGENVLLEGTLHETYHLTMNGDKFHLKIIDNPQGITGTGEVTGEKYQATGETQEEFNENFTNGHFTDSYVNNFKIIGGGTGNNYLVHENYHMTVNANGTVTTTLDHLTIDCK